MKQLLTTAILAICLISAGAAFAGGVTFGAGGASFSAESAAAGELVVTGPAGFKFSQSFKAGEAASFSLFDADGGFRADGIYSWQITVQGIAAGERDTYVAKAEPQWGTFTIKNGAFADPNVLESLPTKDQVILDDLIVDGSICVGMDCVNGESFGFDTLRLKENNLRIRAVDTSTSASFPSRDWQITFNDSANGGANKFSIDDIDGGRTPFTIEAGAPSHSLYVDDGGRMGLGTSTPVVDIHVKSGNTPTLRLEQDGTSGFTAQTWDVAGNEANFFVRDATNGSTLPFRIFPGAPSDSLDIAASGDIGVGTSSPNAGNGVARFLEVKDGTSASVVVDGGDGGYGEFLLEENDAARWSFGYEGSSNRFYIFNYTNNREDLKIEDSTGQVEILNGLASSSLTTGGNAGTAASICTDTNGALCICGTCA